MKRHPSGAPTFLLAVVVTASVIGVVKLLDKQQAADRANHLADTSDVSSYTLLASLVGIVGFVLAGSLLTLVTDGRRRHAEELAAAREAEAPQGHQLREKRLQEFQADCPHTETKVEDEETAYTFTDAGGTHTEEVRTLVRKCTRCGKRLADQTSTKYLDGEMTYNRLWSQGS
jgi:hypothetical protein